MLRKLLKNSLFCTIFCFISCSEKQEQDIKTKEIMPIINNIFEKKIDNAILLVFSEYDCESCAKNTFTKVNSIVENEKLPIYGFYLTLKKKNNKLYKDFLKNTKKSIIWKETTDASLFSKVSLHSEKHYSPFVLQIKEGKVVAIKSINRD